MNRCRMKNFHVPLPENLYEKLQSEAGRVHEPATVVARQAIENWIEQRKTTALHESIAAYAAEHGGTAVDLNPDMEAATIESWIAAEEGQ
ncbi:MAG TPA: hypothetical protein VFJ58_23295 [Armatimonadota bacterium]|nr:hypothetical protein [Armatimonadota bacterium]